MLLKQAEIESLFHQAVYLYEKGHYKGDMDVFQIVDILEKQYIEKKERELLTDGKIDYNDEIVSIEPMGELETIDIAVSGDNLFLCNGILTKNSMGLVHTVDLLIGVMSSEEHEQMGQILFKQLKNRYNNPNYYRRFLVGVEKSKMRLFDLDVNAQSDVSDQGTTDDKPLITKPRGDFSGLIVD